MKTTRVHKISKKDIYSIYYSSLSLFQLVLYVLKIIQIASLGDHKQVERNYKTESPLVLKHLKD